MPNLTNSEVVEHVLHGLISKISRRTSEAFAVVALDTIIKELQQQYDFLKYIEVKDTSYSEGIDALNISSDIDSIESEIFYGYSPHSPFPPLSATNTPSSESCSVS